MRLGGVEAIVDERPLTLLGHEQEDDKSPQPPFKAVLVYIQVQWPFQGVIHHWSFIVRQGLAVHLHGLDLGVEKCGTYVTDGPSVSGNISHPLKK